MKKIVSVLLSGVLAASLLAGCSGNSTKPQSSAAPQTSGTPAPVETNALAGTTIKVAASPAPHAEILKVAKDLLAKQGITLEIQEFTDYIQPNLVTEDGQVDANYFQHITYLNNFNTERGTHLVSVAELHYEPFWHLRR